MDNLKTKKTGILWVGAPKQLRVGFTIRPNLSLVKIVTKMIKKVKTKFLNFLRQRPSFAFAARKGLWLAVLLLPVFLLLRSHVKSAQAIWAPTLGSWNYRQQLNVVNSSAVTLSANTTIAVTVDTKSLISAGKLKSDCSDLRVAYQPSDTTNTVLDRHLVYPGGGNCGTSTATKVYFSLQASLASSGTSTSYYVYFGNPSATAPTDTDNAFDIGATQALLVCPFEGSTTCAAGETPSTESGAIRYSAGKSALSFDGAGSDLVNIGSWGGTSYNNIFGGQSQTTIESWAYSTNTNAQGIIADGGCGSVLQMSIGSTGFIKIAGSNKTVPSSGSPSLGWNHIAFVYDGSTIKTYLNGTLQGTTNSVSGNIDSVSNSYVSLGSSRTCNTTQYGLVTLDEFRISNVARYTSNFTPQTTPFVRDEYTKLLLHFDENGDDPRNTGKALDDSGNGNHGTITGAKYVDGLVGVDGSVIPSAAEGSLSSQSYASHDGIFIEEATTNKITNPSFEHETFNTSWTGENTDTTFNLDTALSTFTPKMAKRNSAGPFAAGVLAQGIWADNSYGDLLTASRGNEIKNNFYEDIDIDNGSIVLWVTPEWNGNDNKTHVFLDMGAITLRKTTSNVLNLLDGPTSLVSVSTSDWTAGTTYLIIARWDSKNTLDGTYYASITVNNSTTYGKTSTWSHYSVYNPFSIGSRNDGLQAANAIIEGFTIYRRPLWDGDYGINAGNGDEIEQIWGGAIASSKDPTLITGSWDVVFALPTNASAGELATGTGNAWSHPHASNLLYTNTTNTGGFMMNGTYTSDGWADEGTPSTVAALATGSKIYAGGYAVTSDAANEGIYYSKAVTAGDDWVIRALGHSDGTCDPKVILYDQTNGAEIGSLAGTTGSTRTAPNTYIFTGEAPSGMTELRVKLVNTASSGTCSWHQVEVLANLVNNPSLETGSGDPWIPTGWSNAGSLGAGEGVQDITTPHSGNSAFKADLADNSEGVAQNSFSTTVGKFYNKGFFYKTSEPQPYWNTSRWIENDGAGSGGQQTSTSGAWTHKNNVHKATVTPNTDTFIGVASDNTWYLDDVYTFSLSDVSLTVTPASLANSTETTGIRVDGLDTFTQPITGLTATAGTIRFKYTPRHSAASQALLGVATPYVAQLYGDSDDFISVYWSAANTLKLEYNINGGGVTSTTWDATSAIVAGTTYDMEVNYTGGGTMNLLVNGVVKATLSSIPATFGTAPETAYLGSKQDGTLQADATFGNPGKITLTENTTAPYYKFGSKSAKLVEGNSVAAQYVTSVNAGNTNTHTLSAYVYDGTTGNVGGTVSATIAKLVFNGATVTPSAYTDMGGGWWRLTYSAAGIASAQNFGIEVQAGKTIYVDGVQLEQKAYATTYADGTLGTGYTWTGTAHESTSTRTVETVTYSATNNIDAVTSGSVSLWLKPNWSSTDTNQRRIFVNTSCSNGCLHSINWSSSIFQIYYYDSTTLRSASVSPTFSANAWLHIVATWSTSSGLTIYANSSAGTPYSNAMTGGGSAWTNLTLSRTDAETINASYSDLRVYNAVLNSTQVTDLYNAGLVSRQATATTVTVDNFGDTETQSSAGTGKGQAPTSVWHFDEGYGTTANDSSPNLNALTVSGATWIPASAGMTKGAAISFDGTDDKLSRSFDQDFDFGTGAFTIAGLFRHPSTVSGTDTLLARQSGSTGYKVYMNSSGYMCFSANSDSACTTVSYADSKWHSFSAVRSATAITIYIDGVSGGTTAQASPATVNGNNVLYVGADSDGASNYWTGFLDELAIYPYARSVEQVKVDNLGIQTAVILGARAEDNLTDGLVGYWKLDETAGNTCADSTEDSCDSSGNGNDILWNGNATNTTGKFANGVTFDGTDDYLCTSAAGTCADTENILDPLAEVTVSAWVKPSNVSGTKFLVSKTYSNGNDTNYSLRLVNNTAQFVFRVFGSGAVVSTSTLSANTWYHLVGTRSGTTLKIYINGVYEASGLSQAGTAFPASGALVIGSDYQGNYEYAGVMDDVRIYNRALSVQEVDQLYNWAPGPVAHWNFDEGTGTSAYDISGNGNTGTITGATWVSGKFGRGLEFNGTNSQVQVAHSTLLNLDGYNQSYTIEAWAKATSPPGSRIIQKYSSGGYPISFQVGSDSFGSGVYDGTNVPYNLYGNIWNNNWRHIVMVVDNRTDYIYAYLDGVLVTSTQNTTTATTASGADIYIGSAGGTSYFKGGLDDVKIYNYARSQKQIIQDMNASHPAVGGGSGTRQPAVAYYDFDEGYGTTANNSGSGGSTLAGTITNATWSNSGKHSKALSFDGNGDYVTIGASAINFSKLSGMTISGWVNATTGPIISKYYTMDMGYGSTVFRLGVSSGTTLSYCLTTTSGFSTCHPNFLTGTLNASTWNHFTATYDSAQMKLYINGKLASSQSATGAMGSTASTPLYIGAERGTTGSGTLNGKADDIKIYNYALSPEEVKLEYNHGSAMNLGAIGTTSSNLPSNSSTDSYCPPGQGTTCVGPVAEWNFDEGTGIYAYDKTGNNNTGTLTNGPTWSQGKIGKGVNFDGSDDYINVTDSASTSLTGSITVDAWVKYKVVPTSTANFPIVGKFDNGNRNGYALFYSKSATPGFRMQICNASTCSASDTINEAAVANTWYHVSGVYNGSTIKIYVNGIEKISTAGSTNPTDGAGDLRIGYNVGNGLQNYSNMVVDRTRIYNYARTAAQVAWDYNRGAPIGHWDMDETSGTTAYDGSGNGNNGTITGATLMADGKRGYAYSFDGDGDYVSSTISNLSLYTASSTTQTLSVSLWAKVNASAGTKQAAFGFQNTVAGDELLNIFPYDDQHGCGGNISFSSGWYGWLFTCTNVSMPSNSWGHLVYVIGTGTSSQKMYLNGKEIWSGNRNANPALTINKVIVGDRGDRSGSYFSGLIDDVKIWNYALTAQQVKTEYNNGAVNFAN